VSKGRGFDIAPAAPLSNPRPFDNLFHELAITVATHFGFIYRQDEEDGMREYLVMVKEDNI